MGTTTAKLLGARELMEIYGLKRSLAYAILSRADLPTVRIGGRVFMHRELFEQWLQEQATAQKEA